VSQRDGIYERFHEDAGYPVDAVIVSIGWEPHLLSPKPPGADVTRRDREHIGNVLNTDGEGSYTVP